MAKNQKRKKDKIVLVMGILGLIIIYLFSGNFSFDLFGDGKELDSEPSSIENEVTEDERTEIIIEVVGNKIYVNEKEILLEELMSEVGDSKQVIYRAEDAKQITYDAVKSQLESNDIVIIEE